MKPRPKMGRLSLVIVVLALVAAACSAATDDTTTTAGGGGTSTTSADTSATTTPPAPGGELVVACSDTVPAWDALAGFSNECGYSAIPLVFDPIAYPTSDFTDTELIAGASVTPNDDFSVWTVELRPDMKFSNGDPVTAEDLAFTLDRIANNPSFSYLLGGQAPDFVATIEVVDDLTVTITPPAPNTEILTLGLAVYSSGILPKDFGGVSEEEFFTNPIGSGPYRIVSWVPEQETVLERNPYYHTPDWQLPERIVLKAVPDDNARILGLESGDFDIGLKLPTNTSTLLKSPDVQLVEVDPSAVTEMVFMANVPPFDDVDFRRAVWFGLNREDLLAGAWDGVGSLPVGAIASEALNDAEPGEIPPAYDPVKAKEFLASSAYADGAEFELLVIKGDTNRNTAAQIVQANLGELGITVNITPVAFAEFFDRVLSGQHQAVLYGYEAVVAPASDMIGYFVGTAGFFGGFDTTAALEQFIGIQSTDDINEKRQITSEFETMLAENAYAVPLAHRFWVEAHRTDVQGVDMFPTNFVWLGRVAKGS